VLFRSLGYRIKLLGITKRRADLQTAAHPAGGIELRVHPTLIPSTRLIAKEVTIRAFSSLVTRAGNEHLGDKANY
jgi:hypothetical protein